MTAQPFSPPPATATPLGESADIARLGATGLVLAGGLSTRMGGQDKGLLPLAGRPLVEHACQRLAPQVTRLMISANRHVSEYARYAPVVTDSPGVGVALGPLAGMEAALTASQDDWVVSVACDTPFFPVDLAPRLIWAAQQAGTDLAVARCAGLRQPVFMAAHVGLAAKLRDYLHQGGRKVAHWQHSEHAVDVDFDDLSAFFNINTPEELASAASRA